MNFRVDHFFRASPEAGPDYLESKAQGPFPNAYHSVVDHPVNFYSFAAWAVRQYGGVSGRSGESV